MIQYAVEEAAAAGITDMIFITGRHKRAIEDHFDSAPELERDLKSKNKKDVYKRQALFGAAVKALSVVLAGDRFAFRNFTGDRIGQLDFSSGAAVDLAKTVKISGSRT